MTGIEEQGGKAITLDGSLKGGNGGRDVDSGTKVSAGVTSIEAMLMRTQLCWAGHVTRMEDHHLLKIVLCGESDFKSVQQFIYLGNIISSDDKTDKEIDNRLPKAYRAFGKLPKGVWSNKYPKKSTVLRVYRAIVLSSLLYGSESSVIYHHHLQLLERFHQRCLRSILNIHWTDYVTNVSVLQQAGVTSIEAMLMRTQPCWAGHISRMEDHCLSKIVLCGELTTGCCKRGALKRRYKDSLKQYLSLGHIDCHQWSTLASSHDSWRHTIYKSV
ncbi:hypothetical protein WISP_21882 [Willisornis vidua]|uniref:Uncharacterized protein n=1 Tax=Willisornis vidua TaxID=1566151 RepID=A0ABQ9DTZ8_9PASS|nr:hypothetical protein WISP_21882 [Willisornis vidua]